MKDCLNPLHTKQCPLCRTPFDKFNYKIPDYTIPFGIIPLVKGDSSSLNEQDQVLIEKCTGMNVDMSSSVQSCLASMYEDRDEKFYLYFTKNSGGACIIGKLQVESVNTISQNTFSFSLEDCVAVTRRSNENFHLHYRCLPTIQHFRGVETDPSIFIYRLRPRPLPLEEE